MFSFMSWSSCFFFKQKTAYEMRISDWSSDVCSSDLPKLPPSVAQVATAIPTFIGYTRNGELNGESLLNTPVRIGSMVEYESVFGARVETVAVQATTGSAGAERSEERRDGQECGSTCISRWSPYHLKKNENQKT